MNNAELIAALDRLAAVMISVSTGGQKIQDANFGFQQLARTVNDELEGRNLGVSVPFTDLWEWYGRWSKGDLPSWQSRRVFVGEQFASIVRLLQDGGDRTFEPTGWARIDRAIKSARKGLAAGKTEEDFQAVGLLCREALITLGQEVWDASRHPSLDGVNPSATDAKRRLEAYFAVELATSVNEQARRHARAALDLAVALQHRRTASFRDAAMCLEGTASVINLVAIVEGRRDPIADL